MVHYLPPGDGLFDPAKGFDGSNRAMTDDDATSQDWKAIAAPATLLTKIIAGETRRRFGVWLLRSTRIGSVTRASRSGMDCASGLTVCQAFPNRERA